VTDHEDEHQIGYKALPRGVPVYTSDGVDIGRVHRVQDNLREHIFDGILVTTRSGRVFVDAPEVARITTSRVTLTIDAEEAQDLPTHRGFRGTLETHAKRTGRRWKRRMGR
jgi:sporulation protein YlmC with PRC-barrel domain